MEGRVRDDEGSAVAGATAELLRADSVVRAADSDALGFFRIAPVPAGAYVLRVSGLGYADAQLEVVVRPGATTVVEPVLPRAALPVEGISVQAERSRERVRFEEIGGATVRELALADLQRVPGVAEVDPVRAIEVLPGVVSTSDFSAAFHVRGGSQDQNLILLDGVPVFSPFHLGGFFSVFNADMLDRAELQSGGFPAEHGGRVSSVLLMESDPGDGRFQVDAGLSLLASRVAVGGALPRKAAAALGQSTARWRVSARRSYFDVLMKPAFEFPYHLTDLQGVLEAWTVGGDRLRLTAYTGRDVLDLTRLDPEDFPLRIDWSWGNDLVGARWTRPRSGGGSLDVHASFSRFGSGLAFPDFADTDLRSGIRQARAGVDLETRPDPSLRLRVGADLDRLGYDNLVVTGGTRFAGGDAVGWLTGLYGQATWLRPRRWLLEAGVRLDAWKPTSGDAVLEPAPRLAAKRFFASGDAAVKVAVGRYTQFLHSLRDEELPLGLDFWVLSGERAPHVVSDQAQVGLEGYVGDGWFWSLEGYVRSFEGVVTFNVADDPNDELDDIVSGRGISYGSDFLVRRERGEVTGWLALSLLRARRTFPDMLSPFEPRPEITYPPVFDRHLDADLVLRYPLPWGWEGGLRWNLGTGVPYTRALGSYGYYSPRFVDGGALQWAGAWDSTDDLGGYGVVLEERNGSRYPTYHRLDASVRRTFVKSWGTLTPHLDVLNVYDRRNVLFYFYDYQEDPPVRAGISMFPILPTVGLEVRFR